MNISETMSTQSTSVTTSTPVYLVTSRTGKHTSVIYEYFINYQYLSNFSNDYFNCCSTEVVSFSLVSTTHLVNVFISSKLTFLLHLWSFINVLLPVIILNYEYHGAKWVPWGRVSTMGPGEYHGAGWVPWGRVSTMGQGEYHGAGWVPWGRVSTMGQGEYHGAGWLPWGRMSTMGQGEYHGAGWVPWGRVSTMGQGDYHGAGWVPQGKVSTTGQGEYHGAGWVPRGRVSTMGQGEYHGAGWVPWGRVTTMGQDEYHGAGWVPWGRVSTMGQGEYHGAGWVPWGRMSTMGQGEYHGAGWVPWGRVSTMGQGEYHGAGWVPRGRVSTTGQGEYHGAQWYLPSASSSWLLGCLMNFSRMRLPSCAVIRWLDLRLTAGSLWVLPLLEYWRRMELDPVSGSRLWGPWKRRHLTEAGGVSLYPQMAGFLMSHCVRLSRFSLISCNELWKIPFIYIAIYNQRMLCIAM